MTKNEINEFFNRWHAAWAARDVTSIASLYAPDCKVTSPMFGQLQGRSAVTESCRRLFKVFPDLKMETEPPIIDGNRAAIVFSSTATHSGEFMGLPATGRKVSVGGVFVLTLDDGLVDAELRLYDFTALLIQVGVLRAKPGH